MKGALISIHPRFAKEILAGVKTTELRRRVPACKPGDLIIVYETSPTMAIVGTAAIKGLDSRSTNSLWAIVRDTAGVSRQEYRDYFAGARQAHAIHLTEIQRLKRPISLAEVKSIAPNFHPPQSWCYLACLPRKLITKINRAAKA